MSILHDAFAEELVKLAAKSTEERPSYGRQVALALPLTAAQALADVPKGYVEKAVESKVLGESARKAAKAGGLGAVSKGTARFLAAAPTTPLFLSGMKDIKEAKTDRDKKKGIAKVVASGALYSGTKGFLEAGIETAAKGGGREKLINAAKSLGGARAIMGTAAAVGTAAAIGKARSKDKGKPTIKSEYIKPGLAGLGIGALKGVGEIAWDNRKAPKGLLNKAGLRTVGARAAGRGVAGAAGGVIISKMLSHYTKGKSLQPSKKDPTVKRWQKTAERKRPTGQKKTASEMKIPEPSSYINLDVAPTPSTTYDQVRTWASAAPTDQVISQYKNAAAQQERTPTARAVHYAVQDELTARKIDMPPPKQRGNTFDQRRTTSIADVVAVAAAVGAPTIVANTLLQMPGGSNERLLMEGLDRIAAEKGIKRLFSKEGEFWAAHKPSKTIWGPKGHVAPWALAHEMGHVVNNVVPQKYLPAVNKAGTYGGYAAVILPILALTGMGDTSFTTPTELEDRAAFSKVVGVVAGAAMAPQMVEEVAASVRGLALLFNAGGGRPQLRKALGKMALSFGTYAAPLAAPVLASAVLNRRARKRRSEIEANQLREARQ